jgi:hypothetical protein
MAEKFRISQAEASRMIFERRIAARRAPRDSARPATAGDNTARMVLLFCKAKPLTVKEAAFACTDGQI